MRRPLAIALLLLPSIARAEGAGSALPQPSIPPLAPWTAPVPSATKLGSGASLVVLPRRELPLVHLLVVVKAGAALDGAGHAGLAAATATMLEEGGAGALTGPALEEAFERLGADPKIDCTRDATTIQLTVLRRHLPEALARIGDLLGRPRLGAADWARVKALRLSEIARRHDEPEQIADAVFDRALFGDGHPYGAPPIGTRASVERLGADDLRRFYEAHYGPKTTTVALIGDVDPVEGRRLVERALEGWTSRAEPAPPPKVSVHPSPRVILVDRPGAPQSELRVGHLGLARATPDYPAASLIETVLGGSFTSRLNQDLREKHGYTYGVRAHFLYQDAPGPFEVRTAVRTDVTAPALAEVVAELRAIGSGGARPVTDDEAKKGRALLRGNLIDGFAGGPETLLLVGDLLAHGLPLDTWSRLPEALDRLGAPDLVRAAARLLLPDALTIVVVGDRKAIEPSLAALPFLRGVAIEHRDADGGPLPATAR